MGIRRTPPAAYRALDQRCVLHPPQSVYIIPVKFACFGTKCHRTKQCLAFLNYSGPAGGRVPDPNSPPSLRAFSCHTGLDDYLLVPWRRRRLKIYFMHPTKRNFSLFITCVYT
mmetsp:Transcript_86335/g.143628  ORF Transcript_86335/g.143628 Transcript_86335/m.143628 type:complete len:113 (-) Transcript_86335:149-487(-)